MLAQAVHMEQVRLPHRLQYQHHPLKAVAALQHQHLWLAEALQHTVAALVLRQLQLRRAVRMVAVVAAVVAAVHPLQLLRAFHVPPAVVAAKA
jgi:hypothetical protein